MCSAEIGNQPWLSRPSTLKPYLACIRKCGENPRPAGQIPDLRPCDLRFNWQKSGCVQQVSIFPALPKYAVKNPLPRSKFGQVSFGNSPLNAKTAFRRFPRTKPNVSSQGLITPITLRENLQGRQSNTAKLSSHILSPIMDQPFIKAIVSERWSPASSIPTRSSVNRQSVPIVNRHERLHRHCGTLTKERRPSQEG